MNVIMLAYHACGRVQKMALPLIDNGHIVHLIASYIPRNFQYYNSVSFVHDLGQTINAIKMYAEHADIFHCHNEPSWYITLIKEHVDIPVILDVHDSYLSRVTDEEVDVARMDGKEAFRVTTEERNNFQLADGLVFPSWSFADLIKNEFNLQQPSLVLPSYCYKKDFQYSCKEWLGGITYEGRLDLKDHVTKGKEHMRGFRYCEYEDLAREFHKEDIAFHLYAVQSDPNYREIFKDIAIIHAAREVDALLLALSRHDWGLVGNIFPTPEWDVALPNKLFEYMAACVPTVAINAKQCGIFLTEHKIGIEVNSVKELKERWPEHERCRANLIKKRQSFAMDAHIHKLEELYKKVLDNA